MEEFTPDMLTQQDVAVDSHTSPSHVVIQMKHSKNDPFAAGTRLHLGTTGHFSCPVSSLTGNLAIRPTKPGPLFVFSDGSPLSRSRLMQSRQVLSEVGVDCSGYSGHSFRIGAATTAARLGVSDSPIKTLGRWKSSAFMLYIQTARQRLARVLSLLVSGNSLGTTGRPPLQTSLIS